MRDTIREAKRALREQVRDRLKGLGQTERAAASAQSRTRLKAQTLWQEAQTVLLFAPLPEELDIWPLLAEALSAGKKVALPRFSAESGAYDAWMVQDLERDMQVGHFGIREPSDRCARFAGARLDLILIPGVAFDLQGRRLGRGKGYYDRLLTALQASLGTLALPVTCAVAFDEQIMEEVPAEPHDVRMDCILTPTRWIQLSAG
jgi:5-formyltetrahydrofolate cyclo-ligase